MLTNEGNTFTYYLAQSSGFVRKQGLGSNIVTVLNNKIKKNLSVIGLFEVIKKSRHFSKNGFN